MRTAPDFWANKHLISTTLLPLSGVWLLASALRHALARPEICTLPVICVGNISVGGTGKTPVAAALCRMLKAQGFAPCILTRGYKSKQIGPLCANPSTHSSADIGDEALMLALSDDVCVCADRIKGARFIAAQNRFDIIIMDDGMQNPWLHKDITLAVFDGQAGLGNQRILPAGPLRETLASGLVKSQAIILNGRDETALTKQFPRHMPVFSGQLHPDQKISMTLKNKRLLGFAGIGQPKRFFKTVTETGAELARELSFADHHVYTEADLTQLQQDAINSGAELITTHKDWVRLPPEWRSRVLALPVTFRFSKADETALLALIASALADKEQH